MKASYICGMNRLVEKVKVTYNNGVSQYFGVISSLEFLQGYKPLQDKIRELTKLYKESDNRELLNAIQDWKRIFKERYPMEIVVEGSPIYNAKQTCVLKPPFHQGGETTCRVETL